MEAGENGERSQQLESGMRQLNIEGGSQAPRGSTAGSGSAAASASAKASFTYNAERVLGSGSFGIVYQAQVVETGESVAIKKVHLQGGHGSIRSSDRPIPSIDSIDSIIFRSLEKF